MTRSWSRLIAPGEDGQRTKTNLPDVSILLGWKWCLWVEQVVAILQTGDTEAVMFPFSCNQCWTQFVSARQSPTLQNFTLYQARHSGASIDRGMHVRPFTECKSRGQWRTDQSVQRYERSACPAANHLALRRRTRDLIETLAHLPRELSLEPAKALPALVSETPVNPALLCTQRCRGRIRTIGVPCYSPCKDQTSFALQRSYRVNLRRDIKDCRIAGALLTQPRGTESLPFRCLETCCFLARQLLVARKPWIIASQINRCIWSSPSVRHLFTLSNTWAMTTDLCGYGDKLRKRTGLLMVWIDSRDQHRFEKHCFTKKMANVPSRV